MSKVRVSQLDPGVAEESQVITLVGGKWQPADSVAGSRSTIGDGLPSFAGRTKGDLHHDRDTHFEYVLDGEIGVSSTDLFDYAPGNLGGHAFAGTVWVAGEDTEVGAGGYVTRLNVGGYWDRPYVVIAGSDVASIAAKVITHKGSRSGPRLRGRYVAFMLGDNLRIEEGDTGAPGYDELIATLDLSVESTWVALPADALIGVALQATGVASVNLVATLTDETTGDILGTVSVTDDTPSAFQPRIGFNVYDANHVEEFSFDNLGTLEWVQVETDGGGGGGASGAWHEDEVDVDSGSAVEFSMVPDPVVISIQVWLNGLLLRRDVDWEYADPDPGAATVTVPVEAGDYVVLRWQEEV